MSKQTKLSLDGPKRVAVTVSLPVTLVKVMRQIAAGSPLSKIPLSRVIEAGLDRGIPILQAELQKGGNR